MSWSLSQFEAHKPIMKPKSENVIPVIIRRNNIHTGCAISKDTNAVAVKSMSKLIKIDFVAAAPTYPMMTSKAEIGADITS